jgi:DNA-binding PadR family transcriptional regulator
MTACGSRKGQARCRVAPALSTDLRPSQIERLETSEPRQARSIQIYLDIRYISTYIGTVKHTHEDGSYRRFAHPDDMADRRRRGHHHRHYGHRAGGRHGRSPFDYGELRLLALAMIAEQPRHGYELMKAIEQRMGGSYSPSPGVIYPTLSWLEDMGYAAVEAADTGRKRYRITAEGEAFLAANRGAVDALLARVGPAGEGAPNGVPAPVLRGMENLKLALRLRLRRGPVEQDAAQTIAAALDAAAQAVEQS